jgi:hypothetical protein
MRLNSSSLGNRDTANRRKRAMTDWIRGTACVVAAGFAGSVLGVGCFFLIDAVGLANQDAFAALDRRVFGWAKFAWFSSVLRGAPEAYSAICLSHPLASRQQLP